MSPSSIVHFFAGLTIVGQALLILGLLAFLTRRSLGQRLYGLIERIALPGALTVALVATIGSLTFSEVAHFTPCLLCWYQRIAMYPQVVLLGLAVSNKNRDIVPQILIFSIIGAIIAAYHYYLQLGGSPIAPCSADAAESCARKVALTYGYITIPMMALTAFCMNIVAMLIYRASRRRTLPAIADLRLPNQ